MQDTVLNLVNAAGLAWWVEIITDVPHCTYYFGPFVLEANAHAAREGYIEDLEAEGAQGIHWAVRRCKPSELTIGEDVADPPLNGHRPAAWLPRNARSLEA